MLRILGGFGTRPYEHNHEDHNKKGLTEPVNPFSFLLGEIVASFYHSNVTAPCRKAGQIIHPSYVPAASAVGQSHFQTTDPE